MKRLCILIFLTLKIGYSAFGQSAAVDSAQIRSFESAKKQLILHGAKIMSFENETERLESYTQFAQILNGLLQIKGSFDYDFSDVKNLSAVVSNDSLIRIYTWALPFVDGSYRYGGFVQIKSGGQTLLYKLVDNGEPWLNEFAEIKTDQWYGAIYYRIISTYDGKKTVYTLLGWDGHSMFNRRKIVDILKIDSNLNLSFGEDRFDLSTISDQEINHRVKHRLIYDFSSNVSMTLNWHDKLEGIIMDHLVEISDVNSLELTYGPDLSFDLLKWNNKKWVLELDVLKNNSRANPVKDLKNKPSMGLFPDK